MYCAPLPSVLAITIITSPLPFLVGVLAPSWGTGLGIGRSMLLDYWPINYMRGYGQEGVQFSFEAGRKCPSGEGTYVSLRLFRGITPLPPGPIGVEVIHCSGQLFPAAH